MIGSDTYALQWKKTANRLHGGLNYVPKVTMCQIQKTASDSMHTFKMKTCSFNLEGYHKMLKTRLILHLNEYFTST